VASYDRAGFGWSSAAVPARTSAQLADELHEMLRTEAMPEPYLFAAHSFGAYVVMCFTEKYPQQVAGLVLLDPLLTEEWREPSAQQARELRQAVMLSRLGAGLCRVGFVRLCLKLLAGGSTAMPRTVVRSLGSAPLALTERLAGEVRKLPRELWPQVRAMWSRASSYATMAAHLQSLTQSAQQTEACRAFAGLPLVVISAGNAPLERQQRHAALAQRSPRGKHIIAAGSGHWIHFDEPALVAAAIREVIEVAKTSAF
jgi:pimeloyl-ACP methyl ester carboxylesterase